MKQNKDKKDVLREYIQKNEKCTYLEIKRDTKIKVERVYDNLAEAYKDAGVRLSKNLTKRNLQEQKEEILKYIKKNPGCTIIEIQNKTKTNIHRMFGSILNAYKSANVKYSIKEVKSGIINPLVIKRSQNYEKKVIKLLNKFGTVKPKVRISTGIIDCLLEYKKELFVVEIKDFRARNNITMSQIKQVLKYMQTLNCKKGLLICPKESLPKRKNSRNIYIDNRWIGIKSDDNLRGRSINHLL